MERMIGRMVSVFAPAGNKLEGFEVLSGCFHEPEFSEAMDEMIFSVAVRSTKGDILMASYWQSDDSFTLISTDEMDEPSMAMAMVASQMKMVIDYKGKEYFMLQNV